MQTHFMFGDRLQIYKRANSEVWQAATRVGGRRFRKSTGEQSLERAKDVAEDWYLGLRVKAKSGEIERDERTFGQAAEQYMKEARALAAAARSPRYVASLELKMKSRVLPFFRDKPLSAVKGGLVQEYRIHRHEESMRLYGRPPARSTMLQEIVYIRQTLKTAEAHGWIPFVPSLSTPYLTRGKKGRRAWFSPEEYKQLYEATRRRISDGKRPGWKAHYEDMHDYVLFMANTGLRPDEAQRLEIRDVAVELDPATNQTILVIDVRGKTGTGYCKSMPGAVHPFKRLRDRRAKEARERGEQPMPTDPLFRPFNREMFNQILREEGLKQDRDGKPRTAYSLRHTYISMRLMEGANIHMVANNCRTSVQMIEEHYASHIKDRIDAGAINVMRPATRRKPANDREGKPRRRAAQAAGEI